MNNTDKYKAEEIVNGISSALEWRQSMMDAAFYGVMQMAEWKDEQYLENVEHDAKSYADGVAKANPDLSEWVLNLLETAYVAGRNKINNGSDMANNEMTNGLKAREIVHCNKCPYNKHRCKHNKDTWCHEYRMTLEMAQWKDEQFTKQKQALIDKACEWWEKEFKISMMDFQDSKDFID